MAKKKRQQIEIDEEDIFSDDVDELDEIEEKSSIPEIRLITIKSIGKIIWFERIGNVYRMSQDFNDDEQMIWKPAA